MATSVLLWAKSCTFYFYFRCAVHNSFLLSGLLCEILTVVFALVAGLDLIVFGLVAVLVADIKSILACLKIDALLGLCGLLKIVL